MFVGLGYRSWTGLRWRPHITASTRSNTPATHPSRQYTDTYYIEGGAVLRPHTSPVQIRQMETQPPPIYVVTGGRCYRRDTPDPTHTPMFTQIEGLAVDHGLTLAHLKGTLLAFARAIFGDDREVRLRPHFFPFTEPSVEVDISCFNCARDGSPCRVCRAEGWVEILGAGMVDPALYGFVAGYDENTHTGFAWGLGIERVAATAPRYPRHSAAVGERPEVHGAVRMKVPVSWLRDYVQFDLPVPELAELMSMTGTKVEAVHRRGVPEGLEFYRVGRVLTRDRHPDADRLSLCTVDVGESEPRQIVCGATNFDRRRHRCSRAAGGGAAGRHGVAQGKAARSGVGRDDAVGARAGAFERARRHHAAALRLGGR